MKVLIYGYYGFKNLGDELILSKIIGDIKSINSKAEITVCTGDLSYTRKIHGIRGINRFSPDALEAAVKDSDVVVVGGGGLMHEYFGIDIKDIFNNFGYNVAAYSIVPLIAKALNKPVFYWCHGVGPIFTEEGRNFTRWFYSLSDFTTLRDEDSYALLKKIYPEVKNVHIDTDPVMGLDVSRFVKPLPFELPQNRIKVGINIRPWLGIDGILENISAALKDLCKENKDILIVPIPFDLSLDKAVLRKLSVSLPEGSVVEYDFEKMDTPEEVISLMNVVDFFVGTRLHSIIVSRLLNIPAFAISYDLKTDKFAALLKIPSIRIEGLSGNDLIIGLRSLLKTDRKMLSDFKCVYKTPGYFRDFIEGNLPSHIEEGVVAEDSGIGTTAGRNETAFYENFIKSLKAELKQTKIEHENLRIEHENLRNQLNGVYASNFWKVASRYYNLRDNFFILKYPYKALKVIKNEGFGVLFGKLRSGIKESIGKSRKSPGSFLRAAKADFPAGNANRCDIIFFSIIDWGFRYQRPQHIAAKFAKHGHRVLYLSVNLKKQGSYTFKELAENIYEIILPFHRDESIYRMNFEADTARPFEAMKNLFAGFRIKEAVAFVEFPLWEPLISHIKNEYGAKVLFDCLDEYSGFENVGTNIVQAEEMLLKSSDYCITTSTKLYEKLMGKCKNITIVRNATEFEHFNALPPNDLLKDIKKPVIGYYGAIAEWFDTETVEHIASAKPDWNIVLIGDTSGSDAGRLEKCKNVFLLGEKPYAELPKYLYWFDVCIIPFKINELTLSTNPVKFYEFISSGKPVVSTMLPELLPYSQHLYLSRDKEWFLKNIELALKEDSEKLKTERIELARENDWDSRFDDIYSCIKSAYPLVSIIVVTYNNLEYTKLCIESIYGKTAYLNFELIIVDNASSDGTVEYVKSLINEHTNIKVILNNENLGFAAANNKGTKESKGEYIIFLNNDTLITRGWISGLIKHLKDPAIGMVGPVTNSIGNEAKINVSYKNISKMEIFADNYTLRNRCIAFEMSVLALYCVAIRREVIDKVGLLDEQFSVGMFEDDDYALRVKRAGFKIICAEDVFIHHFGRASFSKLQPSEYRKIFEENKMKFERKWGISWQPHKHRDGVA